MTNFDICRYFCQKKQVCISLHAISNIRDMSDLCFDLHILTFGFLHDCHAYTTVHTCRILIYSGEMANFNDVYR